MTEYLTGPNENGPSQLFVERHKCWFAKARVSWQSISVNRYLDYSSTAVISLTAAIVQTVVI